MSLNLRPRVNYSDLFQELQPLDHHHPDPDQAGRGHSGGPLQPDGEAGSDEYRHLGGQTLERGGDQHHPHPQDQHAGREQLRPELRHLQLLPRLPGLQPRHDRAGQVTDSHLSLSLNTSLQCLQRHPGENIQALRQHGQPLLGAHREGLGDRDTGKYSVLAEQ